MNDPVVPPYLLCTLGARFIRHHNAGGSGRDSSEGISFTDAMGVQFLCPKCFWKNNGPSGTHSIICWFRDRGVPDDLSPGPGRWNPTGTGLDDLTFVPGGEPAQACSIQTHDWHGFVRDGKVVTE